MKFESQLQIVTAAGVPPFTVNQTAAVINLNADLLDGQHGAYFENRDATALGFSGGVLTITRAAGNLTASLDGRYLPLSGGAMTGALALHSTGTNGFYNGTGDAATYALYNFKLSGWNGMAFENLSTGGTYPSQIVGVLDFRNGTLDMKGGFKINGVAVLTGNQSISITGDASGTGTTSINLTFANSGVAAGTYRSVTVDAKGRVTAGTNPTTLAGYGITDALPLTGGTITGNTTFSGDNHLTFGPNSTWSNSIRIGGNGYTATGTQMASVATTNGNLHLDSAKLAGRGVYLNWYGGTAGTYFGNGSSGQVGLVDGSGNASFSGTLSAVGAITQNGNQVLHAGNVSTYALPIGGGTITGNLGVNTGVIFNRGSAPSITNIQCSIFNELNGISSAESLNFRAYGGFKWQYWDGSATWMQLTSAGLTINGNTTLHAGNYSSYALPLTGGNLTGGLGVSGHITITSGGFQVRAGDGTVAAPGYSFSADTDTGIHRSADNTLAIVTAGVTRATVGPTGTLNVVGALTQGGNQVVHAGNLASYVMRYGGSPGVDLNTITTAGTYRINNTEANRPTDWGQLLVMYGGSDTITQIYGHYVNGTLFTRSGNPSNVGGSGSWTPWRTLLADHNYSSYALPLTGGTITGQLSVNGTTASDILRLYTTGSTVWKLGVTDASGTALNITADFGSFTINKTNGNVTTPGAFVGANFSGPGTGLTGTAASLSIGGNAATATKSNSIAYPFLNTSLDLNTTGGSNELTAFNSYYPSGGAYNQPIAGGQHFRILQFGRYDSADSNFWRGQMAMSFYEDRMWFRRENAQTWQSWREFVHSGNVASYALPIGGGTVTGNLTINGTLSEGGYQAFPERVYTINLSAQSAANFYPIVLDSSPGSDFWHHRFSLEMPSLGGAAAYNMDHFHGEARGQGWGDQTGFYRIFHNCYDNAERSVLGLWRGTQNWFGIVLYVRGGQTYYVRTTSRSVTGYTAAVTLNSSATFAIKNAAGADVSGTSANIGEMFNAINTPQGFHSSYNNYIGGTQVVTNTGSWGISVTGSAASLASGSRQLLAGNLGNWEAWRSLSSDTAASGIGLYDSAGGWRGMVYGNGTSAGFLNSTSGWDLKKDMNGELVLQVSGTSRTVLHLGNYNSYALPLTGGTLTGTLLITPAFLSINTLADGYIGIVDPSHTTGWGVSQGIAGRTGDCIWAFGSNGGTGNNDTWYFGIGSAANTTFGTAFSITQNRKVNFQNGLDVVSGALTQGGNQVLHAGNYNSYALGILGDALTIADWNTLTTFGSRRTAPDGADVNGPPINQYGNLLVYGNSTGVTQLHAGHDGRLAWRTKWNASDWTSWVTALDTGNYTSYAAGLGTYNTLTGVNQFRSNNGSGVYLGTTNNPPLQAFSNDGGAAFMSFHRGGAYAVNFGLDPDNVLRIGGWSAGANRWQLDMSGNNTIAGSLTAVGGIFSGTISQSIYSRRQIEFTSPAANFGNFKQFPRLWSASGSGSNLFTLRVSVRSTWNWAVANGGVEAVYSLYLPGDGTIHTTRDFRITHVSGPATDNIRLGDAVIENGFVSIPVWCANTNPIYATVEQWNGSAILGTTTTAVSEALPAFIAPNFRGGLTSDGNAVLHAATTSAPNLSIGGSSARWATGRTISITGDVTGTSGAFDGTAALSFGVTIANSAVTYAKIQNVAVASVLGNSSASVAQAPQALSMATLASLLSGQTMNIAGSSTSCTGNAATATNGFTVKPGWAGNQNLIAATSNLNNSVPSGFYEGFQATNSPTTGTWYNLINVRHSNTGNDHGFQLAMSYYDEVLWSRSYQGGTGANNGTFTTWRAHLHSGNYNSYAPTLTGTGASGSWGISVTGSSASCTGNAATVTNGMYTSGDQNITGAKYFTSNKGATSTVGANNTYSLEAFSGDGGAAGMSFHRGGYYAVNMGLDPDNVLRIGGWSASANRWQLDMSGNQTLAGNLTAVNGVFSGPITQGGNQVVHAGNVSTYALPIGGGTLTGNLIISGASLYNRITDGTNTLQLGLWDGSNCRIEASGRPLYIVSYNGAITVGRSSGTNLVIDTSSIAWGGNALLHAGTTSAPSLSIGGSSASCTGSAAQLNGQAASYYENRDTTAVGFSAGTLTLTRAAGNLSVSLDGRYLTSNQTISLSGDVTGSGATSIATTIAANAVTTTKINNSAVTYAKIQNVGAASVLGNTSATVSQAPQEITFANLGQYINGVARAWVTFNENPSTGAITINASLGISSITRINYGQYRVNFSTALADANYAVSGTIGFESNGGYLYGGFLNIARSATPKTTTYCEVTASYGDGNTYNARFVHVVFDR